MACTTTAALTSSAPAADSRPAARPRLPPLAVSLPSLPPTPSLAMSWKAASNSLGHRVPRDIVARVAGEAPAEMALDLPDVLKNIQDAWNKAEDKYALASLAAAGFIGLWATNGVVTAVDRLPLVPGVFELVGIGYTGWFAYRNVVFKADREALVAKIKSTYDEIIGSS